MPASDGPIFNAEAGDLLEIGEVAGKDDRVVSQGDRRDLEVARSAKDARLSKSLERCGRRKIIIHDGQLAVGLDMHLQSPIGFESSDFGPRLSHDCRPAACLLPRSKGVTPAARSR